MQNGRVLVDRVLLKNGQAKGRSDSIRRLFVSGAVGTNGAGGKKEAQEVQA